MTKPILCPMCGARVVLISEAELQQCTKDVLGNDLLITFADGYSTSATLWCANGCELRCKTDQHNRRSRSIGQRMLRLSMRLFAGKRS